MTISEFADKYRLRTRRDACGETLVPGKGESYIFDFGNREHFGVMVMPDPRRRQQWGYARTALLKAGFEVIQNGDHEGTALFDPNNPEQVRLAIKIAGVKQRKRHPGASAEVMARVRAAKALAREAPRAEISPALALGDTKPLPRGFCSTNSAVSMPQNQER